MSNLRINQNLKKIMLRSNMPFYILNLNRDREIKRRVIMAFISEEEETRLDANETIIIERGGITFTINMDNIQYYGVIDFSDDSEDMDTIAGAHWFNNLTNSGVWLPSRYNYEQHCAYSDLNIPRIYDTFKPELVAQYAHGCIGKPERCVIFKHLW